MSNSITLKGNNEKFSGKLILTNYGKTRILQRVSEGTSFTPFNFTHIVLGSKLNKTYNSDISKMGNELISFEISEDNVNLSKNTATIETSLDIDGEITMQEIGLFETINNKKQLFAYASGFSMVKNRKITYDLIIDLSLSLTFQNEHYSRFNVAMDETEYALMPRMNNMFSALTHYQLNLERCVEINSRELGYNKAQAFMLHHQSTINTLRNVLLLGRYEKIITRLDSNSLTDCFYYPSEKPTNYVIKNLKDNTKDKYEDIEKNLYTLVSPYGQSKYFLDSNNNKFNYAEKGDKVGFYKSSGKFIELSIVQPSQMQVSGSLQICNRDNIDLSTTASIIYTTQLNLLSKESVILGKINPNEDEYYFDFRVIYDKDREDYGLQFTIYSYDYDTAKRKIYDNEKKLVGHYRIKYFPPARDKVSMVNNETMFSFIYNGDINNPEIKMYINTQLVNNSENFIIDNFNYMGPCKQFKERCTLRNYSQTVATTTYNKPMYYLIPEIENSSILVFNKELTEADIKYLSLISQS